MGVDPISREVLLVGVDEPLLSTLAEALERRATRAARVTLTELAARDAGGVAALVLSAGAARVAQLRMLKGFIDAGRPIIVLSREGDSVERLRKTTGASLMHMSPEDGAHEVASQIVEILHPAEDISSSQTVRPPPGVLPKEVEEEMSGPYRHGDVEAAEEKRAGDSELPELESDLLESVRPSNAAPGHPLGAPPPPPAPSEATPAASTEGAADSAVAAAEPGSETRPHAAAVAPLTDSPGVGSPAMPRSAPPARSRGGAGRAVALGLLGLGVVAIVAVGTWALSGGDDGEATVAGEAPSVMPGDEGRGDDGTDEAATAPAPGAGGADTAAAVGGEEPSAVPAEQAAGSEEEPSTEPAEQAPAPALPAGGSPERRIEAARAADVERDPRESDRLVLQARPHIEGGNLSEARSVLDRALMLDPDNPRTYAWLGRLHTADGNGAQAVQWLELAVERRPRRSEYRLWLGDAQKAAGDVEGARRTWYRVRRDEGDSREVLERLQSLR